MRYTDTPMPYPMTYMWFHRLQVDLVDLLVLVDLVFLFDYYYHLFYLYHYLYQIY